MGLVQVVVQRGLGVEDLLARLAVEARLLLNVQLHQVATHVALPGATTRQSKSGQIPNKQTKGSETRQNDMNLAECLTTSLNFQSVQELVPELL